MSRRKEYFMMLYRIFWTFFRIGPSTFGGGYAMLPAIEREVVQKQKWLAEDEVSEIVSLAGSAPGGVGVNAAAIVGYRKAGMAGAISAVAGVTCPTFLIVLLVSVLALAFQHNPKLEAALKGMHGAVIALILMAAYRMAKASVFDWTTAAAGIVTVIVLWFAGLHPLYVIVLGIIGGMAAIQVKVWLGLNARTEKQQEHYGGAELEYYI